MGNDIIRELNSSSLGTEFVSQLDYRSRGKVLPDLSMLGELIDFGAAVGNELEGALAGGGEREGGWGVCCAASSASADGLHKVASGGARRMYWGMEGARGCVEGAAADTTPEPPHLHVGWEPAVRNRRSGS